MLAPFLRRTNKEESHTYIIYTWHMLFIPIYARHVPVKIYFLNHVRELKIDVVWLSPGSFAIFPV